MKEKGFQLVLTIKIDFNINEKRYAKRSETS